MLHVFSVMNCQCTHHIDDFVMRRFALVLSMTAIATLGWDTQLSWWSRTLLRGGFAYLFRFWGCFCPCSNLNQWLEPNWCWLKVCSVVLYTGIEVVRSFSVGVYASLFISVIHIFVCFSQYISFPFLPLSYDISLIAISFLKRKGVSRYNCQSGMFL